MINALNENRPMYQERLIKESAEYHYRFTRYKVDYSILLIYISEEDGDLSVCSKHLRDSDILLCFQKNFCALVFDGTKEEQGVKASNIILSRVQNQFFAKHLYMSVITANPEKSHFQLVHDLFDLIAYSIEHNMNNLVVESSQVIERS